MARLISQPTLVNAAGNKPKQIEEFIGRVNSATSGISIARMQSPGGWEEAGQTPEFDEYTLVLRGTLQVETRQDLILVNAGQAVLAEKGKWVRYSTPGTEGAEYVAICIPAFAPDMVHRDV